MEISLSSLSSKFSVLICTGRVGISFLSSGRAAVTPHVSCQFATLRERELAHAAVVGPIAGVSAAVGGQAAHRLKTLAAQLAGEGCVKWRSWVGKRWSGRWRWGRYYSAVVVANLRQALQTHGEVQALQVTWCNAGAVGKLVKGGRSPRGRLECRGQCGTQVTWIHGGCRFWHLCDAVVLHLVDVERMCVLSMLEESPCAGEHILTHLAGENGGLFCYGEEERKGKLIY